MCSPEALYAQLLFLSQDSKQNEAVDSLVDRPSDEYVPPKRPVRTAAPRLLGVGSGQLGTRTPKIPEGDGPLSALGRSIPEVLSSDLWRSFSFGVRCSSGIDAF
jgi:hypothetical protein